MSTPNPINPNSIIDSIVKVMTTTNAIIPAAVPGIAAIVGIFKRGIKTGKTLAEIEAEATDSMAAALRTRDKSKRLKGVQP